MVSPIIKMPNTEKQSGISGIPTQLLVLHSGECPLRGGYAQSLTTWANVPLRQGGPEASWHWFVDPIAIVSMVDPQYAAWHASEANPMSEGFEQGGYARFTRAEWLTPEGVKQMDNLAWLMAQRAKANNIPAVWLSTDQITRVTTYGDRATKGFATHRQIDPETRTDPGDGYPYDLLMAKVKAYMSGAITTQSSTTNTGGLTVADINSLTKQLNDIKAMLAPINTSSGPVELRQFIADGTRAAQAAEKQTGPINVTGGQEGIRDFIAKGTRAAQASAAKLAGLEAALKAVVQASGSPVDLEAVTAAAEAGAAKALSNLTATVTIEQEAANG
ncbi:endolysin [Arthrobacter phage Maja]|uniref:Lysin A n=1 Tax=Arthrobacter phage Maja TaxID=2499009 RepID=A0A3S9UN84_9CAUD|nr:endolysin [Arthrobacter phage Maja]AZS11721.1 lysin A [Arthrobacter phage Maja]